MKKTLFFSESWFIVYTYFILYALEHICIYMGLNIIRVMLGELMPSRTVSVS